MTILLLAIISATTWHCELEDCNTVFCFEILLFKYSGNYTECLQIKSYLGHVNEVKDHEFEKF